MPTCTVSNIARPGVNPCPARVHYCVADLRGAGREMVALSSPVRACVPFVDVSSVVGIIKMNFFKIIVNVIFNAIGTLIPPIAAMPWILQVVDMCADSWVFLNLFDYMFPLILKVGMVSQKSSDYSMERYFVHNLRFGYRSPFSSRRYPIDISTCGHRFLSRCNPAI